MENKTRLGALFDRVLDVCIAIACAIVVLQVVSVSLEVFFRQFFGISFEWITSINEWGLVYLTFLGVAWLQREKGHVGDDSVVSYFPGWVGMVFQFIGKILAIASCLVLTGYGTYVTWGHYKEGAVDFFKLDWVPLYLIYLVIPFGGALWLIQIIREIVVDHQKKHITYGSDK